jgi:hypothetical protein
MSGGFVKLYGSILDSSVWACDHATRIVWITLLAMAGPDGRVEASVGGLARRAQVTRDEVERALGVLLSPDPDDRSGIADGRRIEAFQGGWLLLNYERYREQRTESQIRTAERVRRWREKNGVTCNDVTPGKTVKRAVRAEAEAEEKGEAEGERAPARKRGSRRSRKAPPDFVGDASDAETEAEARGLGIDVDVELVAFKDHDFDKPKADWHGTWRNWLRREIKFRQRGGTRGRQRPVQATTPELMQLGRRAPVQPSHGADPYGNADIIRAAGGAK